MHILIARIKPSLKRDPFSRTFSYITEIILIFAKIKNKYLQRLASIKISLLKSRFIQFNYLHTLTCQSVTQILHTIYKKNRVKLNKNKLATNLIYTFAISGHVMCSPIAPTLSAIIFAHVEKATQEMAINAQI